MSERLNFEFFCPADKQERALEILATMECLGDSAIHISPAVRTTVDRETADVRTVEGFGLYGQALMPCIQQIAEIMEAAGITGTLYDNRIIVKDPNNPPTRLE